jgi:hypothetical protein
MKWPISKLYRGNVNYKVNGDVVGADGLRDGGDAVGCEDSFTRPSWSNYSARSASTGFTEAARYAGSQLAIIAETLSTNVTPANVPRSHA